MAQPIKFGLTTDYLGGDVPYTENRDILLSIARTAHDAGFDLLYMGQHFMDPTYVRFQPLPMMARLAAETEGMTLVYGDITSLNDPIRVAHDLVTLDAITDGRAILLSVLGYVEAEFAAFGRARSERASRLNETYEVVARLCAGEEVTFEGRYSRLVRTSLGLLGSVAKPRPPIWVTAHSDRAIQRAAMHGDAWFISHQPTFGELRDQIPRYFEFKAGRGSQPYHDHASHGIALPLIRETFVAESSKRALAISEQPMMRAVSAYVNMGQLSELRDPASYTAPFQQWRQDRALIGDPDEVSNELARYISLGVDCPVLKIYHQGMPLDDVLASIRLIGQEVIPRFR